MNETTEIEFTMSRRQVESLVKCFGSFLAAPSQYQLFEVVFEQEVGFYTWSLKSCCGHVGIDADVNPHRVRYEVDDMLVDGETETKEQGMSDKIGIRKMTLKVIAFDCFGTVFGMDGVSRDEIDDYVRHVRKNNFTPYQFPASWLNLSLHPDAEEGVQLLQAAGYKCVTLSNGAADLLGHVSRRGGIFWDKIIDLAEHRVYKPHVDAYRTVEKEMKVKPAETLMVTANPTFGDIEGAAAIGMQSQVIRQPGMPQTIIELAKQLGS